MGGMQTQIYRQTIYLSKKGVKQIILPIGMPQAPKRWRINHNAVVIKANVPMIPIKSRVRGIVGLNIYWGIGVILVMRRMRKKYYNINVIHAHCSGVAAPLIIGMIAKYIFKRPLLYTVHCCRLATYHPMSRFDAWINKIVIGIEKYCFANADAIITLTNKTKNVIHHSYKVEQRKLNVIPDLIDYNAFLANLSDENADIFHKKYHIDKSRKNIAFVGRIAHEKGWQVLYDAFKQLHDASYQLTFFGDGNNRAELERFIKNDNLSNCCQVTGYLPNDQIALAINSADVIIMPSLHEEFGGLILEVAAVGKAVIASGVGGITELIEDGVTGIIFQSESVTALSEAIRNLFSDNILREKLGKNLNKSMKKYDLNQCMNDMLKLYKKEGMTCN
jgi:2-deoxystreptamine N-acetyl-D-glucosaminyltransferase/2-deoxystreptamine glucosyltransferase